MSSNLIWPDSFYSPPMFVADSAAYLSGCRSGGKSHLKKVLKMSTTLTTLTPTRYIPLIIYADKMAKRKHVAEMNKHLGNTLRPPKRHGPKQPSQVGSRNQREGLFGGKWNGYLYRGFIPLMCHSAQDPIQRYCGIHKNRVYLTSRVIE
jgi:hypothetical protein